MNAEQAKILSQFFHQVANLAEHTLTAFVESEETTKQVLALPPPNHKKGLYNRKEIAELLGVSVRTIGNLISDGLPTVSIGERRIQFKYEDVLNWLKDNEIKRRGKIKLRVVS